MGGVKGSGAALVVEQIAPAKLKPAPYNPRQISDEAYARLKRGIQTFGLVDPIVARKKDRLVIGGHQRLRASLELELPTVPVVFVTVTDDEAAALNVLLNNPTTQGQWDLPRLSDVLSELDANGYDATETGFDMKELQKFLVDHDADKKDNEDFAPAQWLCVVECRDEQHLQDTYTKLSAAGHKCKLIT